MTKSVGIIGAGFSGLAAASCLAKNDFNVTIYEKNADAGGRARKFESGGFLFDMGPSWYWMPEVFERFFTLFGRTTTDFYPLVRLDPSYRVHYGKGDYLDIPAGEDAVADLFEQMETGSGSKLHAFLKEARYKYDVGINSLVYKPGLSIFELMDARLLKGLFQLHVFQSISTHVRRYFRHKRIIELLEFPVLFLGAMPSRTPALYSLMNYADIALGTWYPMGGMHKIIDAMSDIARSLGVGISTGTPVDGVVVEGNRISRLVSGTRSFEHDYFVASADYHHVEQELLPESHRQYSKKYWDTRTLAPSSLLFYLGVDKKIDNLLHHNLFFDEDFTQHAREIYEKPQWPTAPQFYVSCPSKTDPSVAPPGKENLMILIPVAPGLRDDTATREKYFDLVLKRLEFITGDSISDRIVYKRTYAHRDFDADYHAFKGNAYGLANTLLQTANLRPSMVNKKLKNLFYTGQLTVPGPGMPPSIISGQVVAAELIKRERKGLY